MPIYDYLCTAGHRFERMQSFSDDTLTVCEVCGKPVQRVLHAPAVHFKGKGFYSTDYGRGGKAGGGDKSESGASSSSDSGSKESSGGSSEGGSTSSESKSSDSASKSSGSDSKSSSGGEKSSSKQSDSGSSSSSKPAA